MFAAYVTCTCLAALACAYAFVLNVTHAPMVVDTAHRLGIPTALTVPFGLVLGAAGLGLLAGLVVPALGIAAAAGLVAYFLLALAAHLRARDRRLAWALGFLALSVAALVTAVAHHAG